ncbi:tRNA preQ1(34) S-adenosylmethionine ribosyltransferase-isomerase QueA [Thioalkalivibrio sp. XN279]|uniref:tRNA preQ1(34) S-adenosylmethionine ribosyltransferase-isomerase QueA n=1 Tax=Thioalkalivibrio sp. XN279 TaxID=2714953 RepID=UPI00140AB588|nr:tRNA preQ1(34) S-adenosylmethionine ribosyltransferase-isomerase QueA [Thioalkalivibrio sp. XN279]NHA15640.1 tRNA preQ1(34) S-adenosylmethionine ribosyltransferase-isomerase QueA [Thioalkalivibrio sp. XN279]
MQRSDFAYDLPEELIAQAPLAERGASRLLVVDAAAACWRDAMFRELPSVLRPGDLLVLNDTRVIPARAFGRKESGGRLELLVERLEGEQGVIGQLRVSKPPAPGTRLLFEGGAAATVTGRTGPGGDMYALVFDAPVLPWLESAGHMPLPPYIRRADEAVDRARYQTVYGREPGAVAAPTAGLHFDEAMLARLAAAGIETATITLHVGAGTFQPVRADDPREHRLHAERVEVSPAACAAIRDARARGGRVVAVGTTVVRSLETAAAGGELQPFSGESELFILPGYRFRVIDALVTNFHLPESSLLMLVCAFGGTRTMLSAYRHAVAARYRFFSYGDAMFITPTPSAVEPRQ